MQPDSNMWIREFRKKKRVKLSSPIEKKVKQFLDLIFIICTHALDNDYKMLVKYLPLIFLPCVLGFPKKVHIGEREEKKKLYSVYKFCGTTSWTRKVFSKLVKSLIVLIRPVVKLVFSLEIIVTTFPARVPQILIEQEPSSNCVDTRDTCSL